LLGPPGFGQGTYELKSAFTRFMGPSMGPPLDRANAPTPDLGRKPRYEETRSRVATGDERSELALDRDRSARGHLKAARDKRLNRGARGRETRPMGHTETMILDDDDDLAVKFTRAVRSGDLGSLEGMLAACSGLVTARLRSRNGRTRTPLHEATDW